MTARQDYKDVAAATRTYIFAESTHGWSDLDHARREVAREMGLDEWNTPSFRNQVKNALDAMADAGELVKQGGLESVPWSAYKTRSPIVYRTPENHAAYAAENARRVSEAADRESEWIGIHDRLTAIGLEPKSSRGKPVNLARETWRAILPAIEKAAAK